ncbi:cytochrome P450 [Camillea tinctor]|nr:cytochrome P450 [Camillea tinctor]
MSQAIILLAVGAGCFVVLRIILFVIRSLASPLRAVGGPFLARFTDLWYVRKLSEGEFEKVNKELHEKYGSVVRYGPNRYTINDPDAVKLIYGHGTEFPKSTWFYAWSNPPDWNLFAELNPHAHGHYRRQYQSTYSMSALVEYEPYVDECIDIYTQRLSELSNSGIMANMGHWMQCYAFDVIGCITYSKRFGFLDQGKDIKGIIGALEKLLVYATMVGVYPSFHRVLLRLNELIAKGTESAGVNYVLDYTKNLITENQATPKVIDDEKRGVLVGAKDFLSKFVEKHTKDPNSFTRYHILQGCANNMIAGSDTTAISLSSILYHLLKYPETLAKLREEISTFQEAGKVSYPYIKFKEAQEMPYLQAVIKEALRLHPATGLPIERVVPAGGATISGKFFPEGTIVGVNTWIEHRNTLIWGEDANEFRPERWLSDDSEKISVMNRHWMPFGLGSRTCIGRHIAHLEISKAIPRLVRDFDFELSEELSKKDASWSCSTFWFVKPRNFLVYVRNRSGL